MERFLTDIRIECKYLAEGQLNPYMQAWINEGQGIPNQLDTMLEQILSNNLIQKTFEEWVKDPSLPRVCSFDMCTRTAVVDGNFLGPGSTLSIKFLQKEKDRDTDISGYYGGVVPGRFNKSTGLLDGAKVHLTCHTDPQDSFKRVRQFIKTGLAHELTHVFEDFNRRCTGVSSLSKALRDRDYQNLVDGGAGIPEELQWLTYVLDPAEQKAFIASAVSDINDCVKSFKKKGVLDRLENIRNIDKVLQMTDFWSTYAYIRDYVENYQWDRIPPYKQEEFVMSYNALVQGDASSPFSREINTYNQFLKKLRAKWTEFDNKLRTKASQAFVSALYNAEAEEQPNKTNKISESFIYQAF